MLLREHRGPIRADLRREYGVDLDARDVRPTVLLDLIESLSPGAALHRAIDPDAAWSPTDLLLAAVVDEIRYLTYVTRRAAGDKRARPPEPVPRPGVERPTERKVKRIGANEGFDTIAEFDAWYSRAQASRPEIDTRGRAMPPRDARGRFVTGSLLVEQRNVAAAHVREHLS